MTTLNIEGRKVQVSDDFLSLSPEEQERTVEEIAASLNVSKPGNHPLMGQLNKGIAESVGGLVDFINPFDKYTGSAAKGLEQGMNAVGIETAQSEPNTITEAMMRGSGQAAGAMIPAGMTAKALSGASGLIGSVAGGVHDSLASLLGAVAEVGSGGIGGAAAETAENMGAPEWVQDTAAILAPMSLPAAAGAAKAAVRISPAATLARRGAAAMAPYTHSGAKAVATERLQSLAGGPARAEELAGRITKDNPLGLTPAQQTGDANMLAVQKLAAEQDPELRAYLEQHAGQVSQKAQGEIEAMGGDVEAAQRYFEDRRRAFTQKLQQQADSALGEGADAVQGINATRSPGENGQVISRQISTALDNAKLEERALWDAIPKDVAVPTSAAKAKAEFWADELGRAGADDMPRIVRQLLIDDGGYGGEETVREMHRLYSKLREIGRNARAGNNRQETLGKVADDIADAILDDLGAKAGTTEVGRQINEARAFSAAMHETFDRGAPGRLLKRTTDGDTAIDPEMALNRTVGRGGTEGAVTSRQIEDAGGSSVVIRDYLAGQFAESATNPGTGEVTIAGARRWAARNKELLDRYPELRADIDAAVSQRENSEQFAARITARIGALEDTRQSVTARFIGGQAESAYKAITEAKNPIFAARRLANEARKDPSGQALAGLKGALANHLIATARRSAGAESVLDASALSGALSDPITSRAMSQIFTESELSRMRLMTRELAKAQAKTSANIGTELSGAQANRIIEWVARIAAARHGAKMGGGGGGSIQTAQMASSRVKELLNHLTTDKASQMIADAVTDPELFKALLTQTGSVKAAEKTIPRFIPYLLGGSSVAAND